MRCCLRCYCCYHFSWAGSSILLQLNLNMLKPTGKKTLSSPGPLPEVILKIYIVIIWFPVHVCRLRVYIFLHVMFVKSPWSLWCVQCQPFRHNHENVFRTKCGNVCVAGLGLGWYMSLIIMRYWRWYLIIPENCGRDSRCTWCKHSACVAWLMYGNWSVSLVKMVIPNAWYEMTEYM